MLPMIVKAIAGSAIRPRHCAVRFACPMGTMTCDATNADQIKIAPLAMPAAATPRRFTFPPADSSSVSEPSC